MQKDGGGGGMLCRSCLQSRAGRARLMSVCAFAGEGHHQVHQQDLPPAGLPPDPPLQVDQAERAQEEVPGLVSGGGGHLRTFLHILGHL